MNKTVNINLGGFPFLVDEDAYQRLLTYIETLKGLFKNDAERKEIIEDIEGRIAEMCAEIKASQKKEVIALTDVDNIIAQLGEPDQIAQESSTDEDVNEPNESQQKSKSNNKKRKLYRDSEDVFLAGVASGVSHYLGINDPIWLRLILVVTVIAGAGAPIIGYLILWALLPQATTTSQKLEMKGEEVNLSNIEKKVKEGYQRMNDGLNQGNFKNALQEMTKLLAAALSGVAHIIVKLVGILILVIGFSLLAAACVVLVMSLFGATFTPTYELQSIQVSRFWLMLAVGTSVLFVGIPLIAMIFSGFKMLNSNWKLPRASGWVMLGLWVLSWVLFGVIFASQAKKFAHDETLLSTIPVEAGTSDTLTIITMDDVPYNHFHHHDHSPSIFGHQNVRLENGMAIGNVDLNVVKSTGDFKITQSIFSMGANEVDAKKHIDNVQYEIEQGGNQILFPWYFKLDEGAGYRFQEVRLTIHLPEGKTLYFDESIEDVIYDVKNVTDTWDGEMGGYHWRMEKAGLTCLDCDFVEEEEEPVTAIDTTETSAL